MSDTHEVEQQMSDLLDACLKEANQQVDEIAAMQQAVEAGQVHLRALEAEALRLRSALMALVGQGGSAQEYNRKRRAELREGMGVE